MYEDKEQFVEVYFFYCINVGGGQWRPVALISLYSAPDPTLLKISSDTLLVCQYQGDDSLVLVRVRLPWVIYSHPNSRGSTSTTGAYPPVMLRTAELSLE